MRAMPLTDQIKRFTPKGLRRGAYFSFLSALATCLPLFKEQALSASIDQHATPLLPKALLLLRIGLPGFFMAHAAVRVGTGSISQFAAFLGNLGFPMPLQIVWLITIYELSAGILIALGIWVRWLVPGLMCIATGGIVLIHRHNGWFVGEHGTGGMEYSVCLLLGLLILQTQALDQRASKQR